MHKHKINKCNTDIKPYRFGGWMDSKHIRALEVCNNKKTHNTQKKTKSKTKSRISRVRFPNEASKKKIFFFYVCC